MKGILFVPPLKGVRGRQSNNDSNNYCNKKLKGFARANGKRSTLSEKTLCLNLLKSRGLMGYQFLRQRAIDKYVVDFLSKDLNLIIELDGLTHEGREKEDLERKTNLETLGYNMIRFDDTEVVEDFSVVREILERWIENYELAHPEVMKFKKRQKRSSP